MRKLQLGIIVLALLSIIVTSFITSHPAQAQEPAPYVCRADAPTIRYEFRDIPQSWLDTGGWWYIADDIELEGNILKAGGIPAAEYYSDNVYQGEAAMGDSDGSVILKGDVNTAPCDVPVGATPGSAVALVSQVVMSTNRTCTVKYPQIILVCG